MRLKCSALHFSLAGWARYFDLGDDFASNSGRMPCNRPTSAAGTFTKAKLNVLNTSFAIDLCATFSLHCLLGQLETNWTSKALL